jgi:hypothetical protein
MKFKNRLNVIPLMFLTIVLVSFVSCNNSRKKTSPSKKEIKQDIEEYTYPLVSSFDITKMLSEIEASYIVDISNDTENVEKYFTEQSKALNLGVYSIDLAYAATYNQKADIQEYFKVIEVLVSDLDLTRALSKGIADDIERNLDNQEKLVEIISDLSEDAYSYLNKQGRKELSYLILAGSAIEGLYLTLHISDKTFQNPKIVETILYQKEPLTELEGLMAEFKDTELSKSVFNQVKKINAIFAMDESTTAITQEQISLLIKLVEDVRNFNVQ